MEAIKKHKKWREKKLIQIELARKEQKANANALEEERRKKQEKARKAREEQEKIRAEKNAAEARRSRELQINELENRLSGLRKEQADILETPYRLGEQLGLSLKLVTDDSYEEGVKLNKNSNKRKAARKVIEDIGLALDSHSRKEKIQIVLLIFACIGTAWYFAKEKYDEAVLGSGTMLLRSVGGEVFLQLLFTTGIGLILVGIYFISITRGTELKYLRYFPIMQVGMGCAITLGALLIAGSFLI